LILTRRKVCLAELIDPELDACEHLARGRRHDSERLVVARYVFVAEGQTGFVARDDEEQGAVVVEVFGDFVVELVVDAHEVEV